MRSAAVVRAEIEATRARLADLEREARELEPDHIDSASADRRAAIAMRRGLERFGHVLPAGWDAVALTDEHGHIQFLDESARRHYRDGSAGGGSFIEIVHPDDALRIFHSHLALLAEPGEPRRIDVRLRLQAEWAWVEIVSLNMLADPEVAGIISNLRDVTERKKAELALIERESSLEDFLDNGSDLIHSAGLDGEIRYANQAWLRALGYTKQEALGRTLFDVVDPEHHELLRKTQRALLEGRSAAPLEIVFRTKSGRAVLADGHLRLRTEDGQPAAMRGFFRDVTRSREAEVALRASRDALSLANAKLEQANRAKDEFLASMSHELRTPLNAVLGLSEALQEEAYGDLGDRQRKAIKRIEESGRHLLALINDILDLSKIEAGKMVLELRQVSVDDVCRSSLRLVQEAAHKKRVSVSFQVDAGALAIRADERRLKQILVNLLSNAVKFTPQGGSVGLDVTLAEASDGVRFTVWDTGIGIAASEQTRLFQSFVQLDSSLARQHSGTGLGLALVRRLVDLHGGGITVESEPGKGSRFSFVLPGRPTPDDVARSDEAPGSAARGVSRALVVEDSTPIAEQLVRYLLEIGVEATMFDGDGDVVARVAAEQPHVVVLGLPLPAQDAPELLARLAADPRTEHVPVILAGDLDGASLGAAEHLLKPVARDQIRIAVARVAARRAELGGSRSRRPAVGQPTRPARVLVAEDDETNVTLIVDFLQARGYDVFVARNGREAVDMARDLVPDLVLMDIQMPILDGIGAIRELRADKRSELCDVPIVAVTALAMSGDRERCIEAGASDYLSKPIGLKRLAQMVEEHLRAR